MLLNRETAAETVRLLSEGFDLPVRVYISHFGMSRLQVLTPSGCANISSMMLRC